MSVQYSDVPAGGIVPIPPAIPQGMLLSCETNNGRFKTNFKNCSFIRSNHCDQRTKKYCIYTA